MSTSTSAMTRVGFYPVGFEWTEYAQAIADQYLNIVPWYLTVLAGLTGTADEHRVVTAQPYQYDVLIFGAVVEGCVEGTGDEDDIITEDSDNVITEDGDQVVTEAGSEAVGACDGQQIYLQVADTRSLLSWATATPINAAPMSAYGGGRGQPTPILRLPEAFFLPANVGLRHDFKMLEDMATGGSITWVGVQLINPRGPGAPKEVQLSDGSAVGVGTRIPWLGVIGVGRETTASGHLVYALAAGARYLTYTQPAECDIEIHDIAAQFFASYEVLGGNVNDIQFSISDTGERLLWSQSFTPAPAVMGDPTKVFPGLPLSKPYILKKGRQLELTVVNNGEDVDIVLRNAYVTVRGVKVCGF